MSRHRWKEVYVDKNGVSIDKTLYTYFFSNLGANNSGNGTLSNPYKNKASIPGHQGINYNLIVADGHNNLLVENTTTRYVNIIGQSMYGTRLFLTHTGNTNGWSNTMMGLVKDCLFVGSVSEGINGNTYNMACYDSIVDLANSNKLATISLLYRSILRNTFIPFSTHSNKNILQYLVLDALKTESILQTNLNIFESCDITIDSAATLNSYKNNYHGFTNCRFKIGAETDYTALTGTTEAQLRNNFKSRCEAQGFAVPDVTDYNETLPMGRWVFADKCTFDGYILRGSIIDKFQTRRFILLGNTGKVVDTLPIGIGSEPFSFNPNSPKDNGIALNENSIALSDDVLLDQISDNRISSSIGMLKEEGLAKLTLFDVVNNFDSSQGVRVAGDRAFGEPITKVDADTNYLIRSTDESEAIVTYNGVNYSSSLSTRNNIFRGVTDKSTFEKSANAVVYPVTDLAQQSVVEMRIVRELPPQIIKNGNLLADFWYFVASDNVNNPTGTIRYKGVDYSFGSSFLVDAGDLTFTIGNEVGNNLHLRRCWVENYDPNDKTYIDYAFWQGKQQPQWVKVIPSDLRCLMTNNKMSSEIFAIDQQGEYVTSGHPDFYTLINGDAGFSKQSFPIVGKFMQVRLNVSTYNAV